MARPGVGAAHQLAPDTEGGSAAGSVTLGSALPGAAEAHEAGGVARAGPLVFQKLTRLVLAGALPGRVEAAGIAADRFTMAERQIHDPVPAHMVFGNAGVALVVQEPVAPVCEARALNPARGPDFHPVGQRGEAISAKPCSPRKSTTTMASLGPHGETGVLSNQRLKAPEDVRMRHPATRSGDPSVAVLAHELDTSPVRTNRQHRHKRGVHVSERYYHGAFALP